jgi:hypothetical protein
VLTRGLLLDPLLTRDVLIAQFAGLAAIILLDIATLMLATALFLSPLEKMVRMFEKLILPKLCIYAHLATILHQCVR